MVVSDFGENTSGRDFVVGDLHGCVSRLEQALREVSFSPARDRLFSVGDLVDRGHESERVMELIDSPWFHAVRGNHEQAAIDYVLGRVDERDYIGIGGGWFMRMPQRERLRFAVAFQFLPLAIEVCVAGHRVGIVHGDVLAADWLSFRRALMDGREAVVQGALWGRGRVTAGNLEGVNGIDLVVVGHTPVERVTTLGNVLYIDTGAVFGHALTLLDLTQVCAGLPVVSR